MVGWGGLCHKHFMVEIFLLNFFTVLHMLMIHNFLIFSQMAWNEHTQ